MLRFQGRLVTVLEFRAHARGRVQRDETGRSPLKICMVTTFFGAHSFGGDAAYVDRLSELTSAPVSLVSVGPSRDQTVIIF